ncbi:MAG: CARDB domain-containing protein, partial [Thermotaleaceae bacterium]
DFGNIHESVYREVFLVGNRGKNKNLNMFYLDQYNASSKKAIPVKYGFRIMQQEGIYTTTDSLDISGGVFTPLTYAGGYLIFGDSKGNIHAYSALKEENLALMNMENSEEKLSRGETYVAAVDVVNYTGESQNNIPMEFYINGDLVYYAKIDIPEDGITVKFQYTLPNNYDLDKVFIEAKLNMREPRDFEETTYEDNVLSMDLKVYRPIDLIAKNLRNNTPVPANSGQIAQVDIQNASDMNLEDILVYYRVNGKNIKSERISLSGNSTVTRSFAWTAPSFTTTAVLSVVVDPEREVNDINRNNNTAIYNVQVNATPTIIPNSCNNGVARGGFNVEYIWQIGSTPPPDSKPIYAHETVNYEETMTMKVTVNTNQQNQNSRGGWEIVPYSKREGISANKVTRSGYGIELKVDIDYSELGRWSATRGRWEIRPYVYFNGMRKDAPLKGANYLNRLKNVKVYANLPNGQRVEMVRTKDGTNAVTYELPEITYTPAGLNETWSGRFFSMPPRTPDGKYPFTIEVVGGGQSNLGCTVEEEIYIYGDVFRDTNVQISR